MYILYFDTATQQSRYATERAYCEGVHKKYIYYILNIFSPFSVYLQFVNIPLADSYRFELFYVIALKVYFIQFSKVRTDIIFSKLKYSSHPLA